VTKPGVCITPPSRALQAKIGGAAASMVPAAMVNAAEKNLSRLTPALIADISTRLGRINALARERSDGVALQVLAEAHQVRSIAGTVGRPKLGAVASVLCAYLEGVDAFFRPDANLITLIAVAAAQIQQAETQADALVDELIQDCAEAATVTMAREGRTPRGR
jgi:HPt (histidine-containing phosphotransfer) domain-containing protein